MKDSINHIIDHRTRFNNKVVKFDFNGELIVGYVLNTGYDYQFCDYYLTVLLCGKNRQQNVSCKFSNILILE